MPEIASSQCTVEGRPVHGSGWQALVRVRVRARVRVRVRVS